jgi:histidine triad (HIT) family protein
MHGTWRSRRFRLCVIRRRLREQEPAGQDGGDNRHGEPAHEPRVADGTSGLVQAGFTLGVDNDAMKENGCVFCDLTNLRGAEVYFENAWCAYASTHDPRDAPEVLPGCGIIIPIAHHATPFDFMDEEWAATHALLLAAKTAQDERLAPDGYTLIWNCGPASGQETGHAHLHVIPRFDDEPLVGAGGRSAIKVPENRRPDPFRQGSGLAKSFGRRPSGAGPVSSRRS